MRPSGMCRPKLRFESYDHHSRIGITIGGFPSVVGDLYIQHPLTGNSADRCLMSQKCGPVNVPLQRRIRSDGCVY